MPTAYKCKLNTGGKSIEQIREIFTGQGLTWNDFKKVKQLWDQFDGLILTLCLWEYDNESEYHLHGWEPEDDEQIMIGLYYAEQFHPHPLYKDDFEAFKTDWAAGMYDPGAVMTFPREEVEEIKTLYKWDQSEPFTHSGKKMRRRKK